MAKARTTEDATTAYARSVVDGATLTGRLVKLAAERHLRDLEEGPARGLKWDAQAARRVIGFFALLNLPTGGKFKLQPSQAFIVGSIFGWKIRSELRDQPAGAWVRRFVTAYVEQGKGQGKTPMAATIGLYGLWMDGEAAAEIYCCAAKEDQALIAFKDAKAILRETPALGARFDAGQKNIAHLPSGSFMRPVSADGGRLSGHRPSMVIADELHEHASDKVIGMLRAGFKFRTQPLLLATTNSGFDKETVCGVYHDHSEKVLTGALPDDTWFAYVCTLDPCQKHREEGKTQPVDGCPDCDDWRDEAVWEKANPCLGTIIRKDYLRREVEGAKNRPTEEGRVKRLNFCLWTAGETSWLPAELWSRGKRPIDVADLEGRECYGGLDVASKIDVTAFVLCFPNYPEPGCYALLPMFWIPEKTAASRQQKDGIPWEVWEREGLVNFSPGETIHPDLIEEAVKDAFNRYCLRSVRYDKWNAEQMRIHLQEDGIEMIVFEQTPRNYNEPCKEWERLLLLGNLIHGDHPVMNWMASNAVVAPDSNGNVKPMKPSHHSPKKIDGICAGVMSFAGAMLSDSGWYTPGVLTDRER